MTVLFLCRGNSARSQMAEAFANVLSNGRFTFASAGTWPSKQVHPAAIHVMAEEGIDMSEMMPKSFTAVAKPIHHIVALCGQSAEECPRIDSVAIEAWNLDDPADPLTIIRFGDELTAFRTVRDQIKGKVREMLIRLEADRI